MFEGSINRQCNFPYPAATVLQLNHIEQSICYLSKLVISNSDMRLTTFSYTAFFSHKSSFSSSGGLCRPGISESTTLYPTLYLTQMRFCIIINFRSASPGNSAISITCQNRCIKFGNMFSHLRSKIKKV